MKRVLTFLILTALLLGTVCVALPVGAEDAIELYGHIKDYDVYRSQILLRNPPKDFVHYEQISFMGKFQEFSDSRPYWDSYVYHLADANGITYRFSITRKENDWAHQFVPGSVNDLADLHDLRRLKAAPAQDMHIWIDGLEYEYRYDGALSTIRWSSDSKTYRLTAYQPHISEYPTDGVDTILSAFLDADTAGDMARRIVECCETPYTPKKENVSIFKDSEWSVNGEGIDERNFAFEVHIYDSPKKHVYDAEGVLHIEDTYENTNFTMKEDCLVYGSSYAHITIRGEYKRWPDEGGYPKWTEYPDAPNSTKTMLFLLLKQKTRGAVLAALDSIAGNIKDEESAKLMMPIMVKFLATPLSAVVTPKEPPSGWLIAAIGGGVAVVAAVPAAVWFVTKRKKSANAS